MIKNWTYTRPESEQGAYVEYLLAPNVVFLCLQDGTGRLLDMERNCYGLSLMAATMLTKTLMEGTTATAMSIATDYRVALPRVQCDLQAFLSDLEKRRLIHRSQKPLPSSRQKIYLPSIILLSLLHFIRIWPTSLSTKVWMLLTLAYFSLRLLGWPTTVPVWRSCFHHDMRYAMPERGDIGAEIIDAVVRTVASRHPLQMACKERALCCWSLLHLNGMPARLVVGINLFPLVCHCWCELEQMLLSDDEERCRNFTPILSYE